MSSLRARNALRDEPCYRRRCFTEGLEAAGYRVGDFDDPAPEDILLLWNRYGRNHELAKRFEAVGARVLVTENAYLPLKGWYALSEGHHNGAGRWPVGSQERWASFGIELQPWRDGGDGAVILSQHARLKPADVVILGQRSIGEAGIASPRGWEESVQRKVGGRIRLHPGKHGAGPTLEQDLENAGSVVTWGSSAALKALIMGIPVFYGFERWIGAQAGRPVGKIEQGPRRDDAARSAMFERLAWAMASLDEIRSGEAICRLLGR